MSLEELRAAAEAVSAAVSAAEEEEEVVVVSDDGCPWSGSGLQRQQADGSGMDRSRRLPAERFWPPCYRDGYVGSL